MDLLLIGSGGREHAIAWKLRQSQRVGQLFIAPGNAGTGALGTNLPIADGDLVGLADAARRHRIGLTVVGPETPLASGIVDSFTEQGLRIAGPTQGAAKIESSKSFAKDLMLRSGIPTAAATRFTALSEAMRYVESAPLPLVVKADGLTAGKGVTVCNTREAAFQALHETMEAHVYGPSGDAVLIEEFLAGREVSVFAFTDGVHLSSLAAACDYKRAADGDAGPNTGGMGSYSPPPFWDRELAERVMDEIMAPVVKALAAEGTPFRGVLYGGLMLTDSGPKVIEFNCRLGDPEAQVVLPRLKSDLVDVLMATTDGTINRCPVEWSEEACVAVVMASGGYPAAYQTGYAVSGLSAVDPDLMVFHAGTRSDGAGPRDGVVTSGGRVLSLAALGGTLEEARSRVYAGLPRVRFTDSSYRSDIALLGAPAERAR